WLPLFPPAGYNLEIRAFFPHVQSDEQVRAAIHTSFPWHVDVESRAGVLYSPVQIGVLRVGDWTLIALGAEPFTETGPALKAASSAKVTFVSGYTNGCNGYLPVASAYQDGGYEIETAPLYYGMPSGFAPGGAELIVHALQSLLGALHPSGKDGN